MVQLKKAEGGRVIGRCALSRIPQKFPFECSWSCFGGTLCLFYLFYLEIEQTSRCNRSKTTTYTFDLGEDNPGEEDSCTVMCDFQHATLDSVLCNCYSPSHFRPIQTRDYQVPSLLSISFLNSKLKCPCSELILLRLIDGKRYAVATVRMAIIASISWRLDFSEMAIVDKA